MRYPEQKLEKSWIYQGITQDVVLWADSFGEYLCQNDGNKKPLTTGQLRKFFGEVKRIEANIDGDLTGVIMLKPLLAYAVGRDKNNRGVNCSKIEEFAKEINTGIDAVIEGKEGDRKLYFKNFVKIFEAIVAYHKFYGAKENSR